MAQWSLHMPIFFQTCPFRIVLKQILIQEICCLEYKKKKREKGKCPTNSELIAGVGSDVVTSKGMAILYGVKTNPKLTKYH